MRLALFVIRLKSRHSLIKFGLFHINIQIFQTSPAHHFTQRPAAEHLVVIGIYLKDSNCHVGIFQYGGYSGRRLSHILTQLLNRISQFIDFTDIQPL